MVKQKTFGYYFFELNFLGLKFLDLNNSDLDYSELPHISGGNSFLMFGE